MPRVVAGTAGGIRLLSPEGKGTTRPTSDRVKEALFSILAPRLVGADVLDLYAGTGQLAIEALSRGARSAVLVDRDRACAAIIRENLARAGVGDRAVVLACAAAPALARIVREGRAFDLVLLDPPYDDAATALEAAAAALAEAGSLRPDALVVLEHDARCAPPADVINLQRVRSCLYGNTMLTFYSGPSNRPTTRSDATDRLG